MTQNCHVPNGPCRPLAAAGAEAEVGVLGGNIAAGREVPQDSHSTVSDPQYLFPNSFKVTGIKHVCDNLVGAILDSLPQPLAFIEKPAVMIHAPGHFSFLFPPTGCSCVHVKVTLYTCF